MWQTGLCIVWFRPIPIQPYSYYSRCWRKAVTHKVNHLPRGRNISSDQCSGGAASQSPVQLSSARRRSVNIRRAGDEPQLEADKRGASFSWQQRWSSRSAKYRYRLWLWLCPVSCRWVYSAMDLSLALRYHHMSHWIYQGAVNGKFKKKYSTNSEELFLAAKAAQ